MCSLYKEDKMSKVRKAVIPAAGLGTRFLPATKEIAKEMLPIVDKLIISCSWVRQYPIVTVKSKWTFIAHSFWTLFVSRKSSADVSYDNFRYPCG